MNSFVFVISRAIVFVAFNPGHCSSLKHGYEKGSLSCKKCALSLSLLCVHGSCVSILVSGGVENGTHSSPLLPHPPAPPHPLQRTFAYFFLSNVQYAVLFFVFCVVCTSPAGVKYDCPCYEFRCRHCQSHHHQLKAALQPVLLPATGRKPNHAGLFTHFSNH